MDSGAPAERVRGLVKADARTPAVAGIDLDICSGETFVLLGPNIDLVGLTAKSDTRLIRLSGGQQRWLDLAIGLAEDPELLFLDEPTTGFDPSARHEDWDVITDLTSIGKTVLLNRT